MMRTLSWVPSLVDASGPAYVAIANAVENSIGNGELRAGDLMPPQRTLAAALGIDFTTVRRGYAEAQRRGLLEAHVGRGTFVKALKSPPFIASGPTSIDMLINHPPGFDNAVLQKQIWEKIPSVLAERGMEMLMRYQTPNGAMRDRTAGAKWLNERVPELDPDRVFVCPGVQGALLAVTMMLARAGDTVCVESLTYPGYILLAKELGIRLVAVEMDADGALPDSLATVCEVESPKAFYCTPNLQNPTGITMSADRRAALVEVARRHKLPIIEDDNYWPLIASPSQSAASTAALPSLASLAPELVYYVSGLSKCVSPALRIAYLTVPDATAAERVAVLLRATATMAAPLSAAVATHWIESGLANDMLASIRSESDARQSIAAMHLGGESYKAPIAGFHLWLTLPEPWTCLSFSTQLKLSGIWVAGTDAFAVGKAPDGVRLCLGAPSTRIEFEQCMQRIGEILHIGTYQPSHVI